MKIVAVHTLINCGSYANSRHWRETRGQIHDAVRTCQWPPGSGSFTIYPQSGKKRGQGNGASPIRDGFVEHLKARGWMMEGPAKNAHGQGLGSFAAAVGVPKDRSSSSRKRRTSPR